MSIFVTADHHFGHANIISYCARPFANVREMDQAMIAAWNQTVGPEDTVYHLGDFTLFHSLSPWIDDLVFKTLHIVPGNHDRRWMDNFCPSTFDYRIEVLPPLLTLEMGSSKRRSHTVVLCHYPMLSWNRSHYGSLHLHGHSHGTVSDDLSGDTLLPPTQKRGRRVDVGVDSWAFAPVALEELLAGG